MAAIGSLLFCTACGNLLDSESHGSDKLNCDVCGTANEDVSHKVVVTQSRPDAFPSTLRQKKDSVQQIASGDLETEATIKQACPECGADEMKYTAVQLRSADEGSTIFFTCMKCGYKFSTNN